MPKYLTTTSILCSESCVDFHLKLFISVVENGDSVDEKLLQNQEQNNDKVIKMANLGPENFNHNKLTPPSLNTRNTRIDSPDKYEIGDPV